GRRTRMAGVISWKVGGEQGQGIDSTGDILATACNRLGYYVYAYKQFSSRIKGGHTNYKVRISARPVDAPSSESHILIALDQETIDRNHAELLPGGVVIADPNFSPRLPAQSKARLCEVPSQAIASEVGSPIMRNVVSVGASSFFLGLPLEAVEQTVGEVFARKGETIQNQNKEALRRGYTYAAEHFSDATQFHLEPGDGKARLLLTGNEAIGLGALAAGCRLIAAYPITPASDILEWLVRHLPEHGGVAVQAEDEISAISTVLGAGYVGVRAMTATSGPGLSLMQEVIGLAHMAEVPFVVVDCQRAGPSTGMPTKHEQSDLLAVLHGSHGETPRIVLTPSNPAEAFDDIVTAFNLADRFQMPVFVVLDLSVALNKQTVDRLDHAAIKIDRGPLITDAELAALGAGAYRRYRLDPSGISPRSLPGQPFGQFVSSGLEHDELGRVSEDPQNRVAMMRKRFHKLEHLELNGHTGHQGASGPLAAFTYDGAESPDVLLIGWGASRGALAEARRLLEADSISAAHLHMRVVSPFPAASVGRRLARARYIFVVENNATGQLAQEIRLHCGDQLFEAGKRPGEVQSVLKYDGRLFVPEEIVAAVKEVIVHAHVG
ncbi:MAG TPA: 2-oxoacid:acceptor oxidoreductase subunit alpha, partial [Limnochordia bacterium]